VMGSRDADRPLPEVLPPRPAGSLHFFCRLAVTQRAAVSGVDGQQSCSCNNQAVASSTMLAAFSPIMIDGALVLPEVSVGMTEASATRKPLIPRTRRRS